MIYLYFLFITLHIALGDPFYSSVPLQSTCPKIFSEQSNGRENVLSSDIFFLNSQSVYFSIQMEQNPNQVSITFWKTTNQITQILPGVSMCTHVRYDELNEALLMTCTASEVYLYKFQVHQFALVQIFQHSNVELISDLQLITHTSSNIQFATLCFQESEVRFWVEGGVLPSRTLYLKMPNNTYIYPSAFNFIFIPYTKLMAMYDVNSSNLKLIDIDLGEIYKTSTKYLPCYLPNINNYIQYNQLWKLIVVFTWQKPHHQIQTVSTLFANDTTVYKQFNISYDRNEINNQVTCMHVLQGTEFVAFGHTNGNITIHNILTSQLIRNISISNNPILDIQLTGKYLNILTTDLNDEITYYQYNWINRIFVETRLTNQPQCVSSCESGQYQDTSYLSCRSCNSNFNCKTCDAKGCVSCNKGAYLDKITVTNGTMFNTCVSLCSNQMFGLNYDNSDDTECVEICPSDIYDSSDRICSSNDSISNISEQKGVTASLTTDGSTSTLQVKFSRPVSFNTKHVISSTNTKVSYIQDCVFLAIQSLKSSDFKYSVELSSTPSSLLNIKIERLSEGGIQNPEVTVTFEGQTCFKDTDYIPLSSDLLKNGLSMKLPWNIVKEGEGTKKAAEKVGQFAQAASAIAAAATIPLMLTNVMYVFWILVNVLQLINFLLYLNVAYPSNIVNFFRAFASFSFDWLPTIGLSKSSDSSKSTFLGQDIVDQVAADPFTRESLTSSFYLNGFKFLQTFVFLYIALYINRMICRVMKLNYLHLPPDATIVQKIVATIQTKLEYTMIITTHQSSILKFSLAIFLQIMGFSTSNSMNVIGFLIAIISLVYLILFLRNCYKKVNLNEMVVGSKIHDMVLETDMKKKYEKYKSQYGVLFMDIYFIFYGRRNYHVFSMIKQALIPFVVVCFNKFTFACILTLLAFYVLNSIFLLLYRPFDRKMIGYLSSVNEIIMSGIMVLIFYIHYVNESSGPIISQSDIIKNINTGWVIIGFLIVLFVFNIVSGIVIEWEGIKQAIQQLRMKFKELTRRISIKDTNSEKQTLKRDKESPPDFSNMLHVKQISEFDKNNKIMNSFVSKSQADVDKSKDLVAKMSKLAKSNENQFSKESILDLNQYDSFDQESNYDSNQSVGQTKAVQQKKKTKKQKKQAQIQDQSSSSIPSESQIVIQMENFNSPL